MVGSMAFLAERSAPSPGDVVPFHLNPGIVVCSLVCSFLGSLVFTELLRRQKKLDPWFNLSQQLGCSISFGLVGIWCMHYIGNRAITLGNGSSEFQLIYSPGFTALSSLIPILTVLIALQISDLRYRGPRTRYPSLIGSGIVGGFAIVGMHYTGNFGISNYQVTINLKHFGGAVGIACVAMTAIMLLVSVLQDVWLNTFKWRLVCATLMAGTVTGMHFEASMGTIYRLKNSHPSKTSLSNTNVIAAVTLCVSLLPACGAIAYFAHRRHKEIKGRALQVTLTCAWFDREGRIMVDQDGCLPSQKIVDSHNPISFGDEFTIAHPAFQWAFKASSHWNTVLAWLPSIRQQPVSVESSITPDPYSHTTRTDDTYSMIFRERFCCAAADLADDLNVDLPSLGTLFGDILPCGTASQSTLFNILKELSFDRPNKQSPPTDVEADQSLPGTGQVMFITKYAEKSVLPKYQSLGYRFMPLPKAQSFLAGYMQVGENSISTLMGAMKRQVTPTPKKRAQGIYLGYFALRAAIGQPSSLEVLVRKDDSDNIPKIYLWSEEEHKRCQSILGHLEGSSVAHILDVLSHRMGCLSEEYTAFINIMKRSLTDLASQIPHAFFYQGVLCTKVFKVPTGNRSAKKAEFFNMIAFHILPDVHDSELSKKAPVQYRPFSLFRGRQQILASPLDEGSNAKLNQELAAMYAHRGPGAIPDPPPAFLNHLPWLSRLSLTRTLLSSKRPLSSDISLHTFGTTPADSPPNTSAERTGIGISNSLSSKKQPQYGGILVTSDVSVEASPRNGADKPEGRADDANPDRSLRSRGQASVGPPEPQEVRTFVDDLREVTLQYWVPSLKKSGELQGIHES